MLLTRGQADVSIDPTIDLHHTAEFIVGSYTGHYLFSLLRTDLPGLPHRVYTMWDLLIRAIVITHPERWQKRAQEPSSPSAPSPPS